MSSIKNKINKLLFEKIETDFHNDNKLVDALHLLLNGNFIKYDFENVNISLSNLKSDDFQTEMFKLNEKSSKRKKNGVYYTPNDVSEYIIANSFINFIDNSIKDRKSTRLNSSHVAISYAVFCLKKKKKQKKKRKKKKKKH